MLETTVVHSKNTGMNKYSLTRDGAVYPLITAYAMLKSVHASGLEMPICIANAFTYANLNVTASKDSWGVILLAN